MAASNLISALKKSSATSLSKLQIEMDKVNTAKSYEDDRFWEPKVDPKTKNGFAIIRFLPETPDSDLPWVRFWKHAFQGPTGKWYIENCLTTIGKECPVCEANNKLWDTGIESNKAIVRKRKRGLVYISNILVISDPERTENEGKVFLFKYGKSIFDKINEKLHPEFPTETPSNPFNFWEGSNFELKIRNKEGYRNYDKSQFQDPSVLFDGDEDELQKVWDAEYKLDEFISPSQFKTYDQLKTQYNKVWYSSEVVGNASDDDPDDSDDDTDTSEESVPWKKEEEAKKTLPKLSGKKKVTPAASDDSGEDESPLNRFKRLANES